MTLPITPLDYRTALAHYGFTHLRQENLSDVWVRGDPECGLAVTVSLTYGKFGHWSLYDLQEGSIVSSMCLATGFCPSDLWQTFRELETSAVGLPEAV